MRVLVKSMFTYQYQQPKEYHFSLDSIYLAKWVAREWSGHSNLEKCRVLDLCAGCGVVGLELSYHLRELKKFDFIEVQDIYTSYFQQNVAMVNRNELQLTWHLLNYEILMTQPWHNKYDLIVSNPPYFNPNEGMLSPSTFKNRCRFFLDSSFENFIQGIINTLTPNGSAYFLQPQTMQHGYDRVQDLQIMLQNTAFSAKKIAEFRSVNVVLIKKKHYDFLN